MRHLIIGLVMVATCLPGFADDVADSPVGGEIAVLKDGVVTCMVYDTFEAGGISCDGNILNVDLSKLPPRKWKTSSGAVGRQVIAGRLCYTMDGNQSGGISCLKK